MPPSVNLMKWWAKHGVEKGRMTRHLSPFEISPIRSLINTMPQKTIRKIQENGAILIPSFVLFVGTVKWGIHANDEHHREHWS
uniref:Cytochrome b-c1 complex subunit 8 n=1 Tax=Globisporangium ultimum (strain ATCC 200006 / CBS 805.95 / DAOM BR144) TaxID=431595 RepID=K3X3F5_GLOUD